MDLERIEKDPSATLDYEWDWSSWLRSTGDTLATSSWSVAGPDNSLVAMDAASAHPPSLLPSIATVWLTGGTLGGRYVVTNHVRSVAGREDEWSREFRILNL
jgi:hypothetical protein